MYLVGCYIQRANAPKQLVAQARLGLGFGLLGLGLGLGLANPNANPNPNQARGQSLMDAQMGAASKALVALGLDSAVSI